MQQQSKTEQLINKNNYRKHKQKLNQIKRNDHNTSLNFYSSTKAKPLDRKKIMMLKLKKQQIEQQNQNLRKKIQKINNSTAYENWRNNKRKPQSQNQTRKASHSVAYNIGARRSQRYDQNQNQNQNSNVIGIFSQCQDGQSLKCFVQSAKIKAKYKSIAPSRVSDYNAIIFNLRQKQNKQESNIKIQPQNNEKQNQQNQQITKQNPQRNENKDNINNFGKQHNPSITLFDNNPKLKQLIKQSALQKNIDPKESIFNQPEKQAHRIVLFKKTKIFYPMTSFLMQISLIQNRLLIIAYGMGLNSEDFKLLISRKRTKQILQEINGNYQNLWNKIEVDITGIRIDGSPNQNMLKYGNVIMEQDENQKQKSQQQRKYEITQDFLQRNYYTVLKESINAKAKQKQQKSIQEVSTNGNGQTKQEKQKRSKNKQRYSIQKARPKSIFRNRIQYHRQKAQEQLNKTENQNQKQQNKKDNSFQQKHKITGVVRLTDKKKQQLYNKNSNNIKVKVQNRQKQQLKTKEQPKKKDIVQKKESKKQIKISKNEEKQKLQQVKIQKNKQQMTQQYEDNFQEDQKQQLQNNYEQQIYNDEQQLIDEESITKNQSKVKKQVQQSKQDKKIQKLANSLIYKSSAVKDQKEVEEYEQSFQPENIIVDQDYEMQYQSNPSKIGKDNISTKAVKKKTINNKSIVDSVIQDEIQEQKPKIANKNNKKRDEVQQYLDEEFEA